MAMIESVAGIINAAPTPLSARTAITWSDATATSAPRLASPKIEMPAWSARLRPKRSPSTPNTSNKPAKTSKYESTIHCSFEGEAPNSCCSVGRATLRIVLSSPMITRLSDSTPSVFQRRACWRGSIVIRRCSFRVRDAAYGASRRRRTTRPAPPRRRMDGGRRRARRRPARGTRIDRRGGRRRRRPSRGRCPCSREARRRSRRSRGPRARSRCGAEKEQSWLLRPGWGRPRRLRDLHLANRDGRGALGDVEGQQRERVGLARGLHRPPDRVAARTAGRERALVAKRAREATESGESDAALVRLVVVVEQVAGHVSDPAAAAAARHRAATLVRPP